jgi:hypothetical protein
VLCRQGELDGNALKAAQGQFNEEPDKKRKLMQLSLCPHARAGQADAINQACTSSAAHRISAYHSGGCTITTTLQLCDSVVGMSHVLLLVN